MTWAEYRKNIKRCAQLGIFEAILDNDESDVLLMSKYLYEIISNEIALNGKAPISWIEGIPVETVRNEGYKIIEDYVVESKIFIAS